MTWRHAATTFPCCGGRRWVVDENSSGPDRRERTPSDGLIPCGTCNFGGWETPENEPAPPWCIECEQRWPCDAQRLAKAAVEAVLPLEVIAAQHRAKPYRELSPELTDDIDRAITIVRAALDESMAPSQREELTA